MIFEKFSIIFLIFIEIIIEIHGIDSFLEDDCLMLCQSIPDFQSGYYDEVKDGCTCKSANNEISGTGIPIEKWFLSDSRNCTLACKFSPLYKNMKYGVYSNENDGVFCYCYESESIAENHSKNFTYKKIASFSEIEIDCSLYCIRCNQETAKDNYATLGYSYAMKSGLCLCFPKGDEKIAFTKYNFRGDYSGYSQSISNQHELFATCDVHKYCIKFCGVPDGKSKDCSTYDRSCAGCRCNDKDGKNSFVCHQFRNIERTESDRCTEECKTKEGINYPEKSGVKLISLPNADGIDLKWCVCLEHALDKIRVTLKALAETPIEREKQCMERCLQEKPPRLGYSHGFGLCDCYYNPIQPSTNQRSRLSRLIG